MLPVDILVARRPGVHAFVGLPAFARSPGPRRAIAHEAADEQVPAILVGEECLQLGCVEDGIGAFTLAEVPIMVEEQPHLARSVGTIRHLETADEEVAVEVHRVVAGNRELQRVRRQRHTADQRILVVAQLALPDVAIEPGKAAVHPHAGMIDVPLRLIALADVRPVDVAQVVLRVEVDEHVAVGQRQITRHGESLLTGGGVVSAGRRWRAPAGRRRRQYSICRWSPAGRAVLDSAE